MNESLQSGDCIEGCSCPGLFGWLWTTRDAGGHALSGHRGEVKANICPNFPKEKMVLDMDTGQMRPPAPPGMDEYRFAMYMEKDWGVKMSRDMVKTEGIMERGKKYSSDKPDTWGMDD